MILSLRYKAQLLLWSTVAHLEVLEEIKRKAFCPSLLLLALQPKWLFFLPQAIRLSLEQSLPPEPKEESTESVSKLRIRTPSGEFFERRFLASSKLQVVFDFVASKGYPWEEYKLLGTFPRRDVSKCTFPE